MNREIHTSQGEDYHQYLEAQTMPPPREDIFAKARIRHQLMRTTQDLEKQRVRNLPRTKPKEMRR